MRHMKWRWRYTKDYVQLGSSASAIYILARCRGENRGETDTGQS